MAIYYVDPYLDAPVGGINGSNNPSARTGTWADPFKMTDVFNSSTTITSINGVAFANGDEIRFKGLASINDFVYANIRTTFSSYYARTVPDSADQTSLTNWKSSLNTLHSSTNRGLYFVSDTDHSWLYDNISATDIPKGLIGTQTGSASATNTIYSYASTTMPLSGLFNAFGGTKNLYLKLIKPTHHIKLTSGAYFLNINYNIKYSAGWTSETTQDGHTILPVLLNGASQIYWGVNNSSMNGVTLDLARMHFFKASYTLDYQSTSYFYFRCFASSTTHYIGTLSSSNYTSWTYLYFNSFGSKTGIQLKIGAFVDYYAQLQANPGSSTNSLTIANYVSGLSPYLYIGSNDRHYFGNVFTYSQYSGNALIFYGSSTVSTVSVLPNSYLYGYSSQLIVAAAADSTTISIPSTVYNFQDPQFTAVMSSSSTSAGPILSGFTIPYTTSTNAVKTKLSPSSWTGIYALADLPSSTYIGTFNYGQLNTDFGILDTEGINYRDTEHKLVFWGTHYINGDISYWTDTVPTFGTNTYDKKPITLLLPYNATSQTAYKPLICYNDVNNNLVIQCSANAPSGSYAKKVSLGYPDIAGKTSVTVSAKVTKNIDFSSAAIAVYLLYKNSSGTSTYATLSSSYDAGTLTYTVSTTLSVSNILADSCHLGLSFYVYNTPTASYTQTYTIKDLQVTIT